MMNSASSLVAGRDVVLTVYFERAGGGPSTKLDHVNLIQIIGNSLRDGAGVQRARYADGKWQAEDGSSIEVVIASAIQVRFADGKMTEPFGPFSQARLSDAALRVGEEGE